MQTVLASITSTLVCLLGHPFKPGLSVERTDLWDAGKVSGTLMANLAVEVSSQRVPEFLLGLIAGPVAAGQFRLAKSILDLASSIIFFPFQSVMLPMFAEVQRSGNDLTAALLKVVGPSVVLLCLPAFVIATSASLVIAVTVGPNWTEAADVLAIFAIVFPSLALSVALSPYMIAAQRQGELFLSSAVQLCVTSLLVAIGASIGLRLGAAGFALGGFIGAAYMWFRAVRGARESRLAAQILVAALASLSITALSAVYEISTPSEIWHDIGALALSTATYVLILAIWCRDILARALTLVRGSVTRLGSFGVRGSVSAEMSAAGAPEVERDEEEDRIVIFQNYYTPYRHALFEDIGRRGSALTVCYAQKPSDEGRKWAERSVPVHYNRVFCSRILVGPLVFFWVPSTISRLKNVIILDNNPTNVCMILWAVYFRLRRKNLTLWLQHIPDAFKGQYKSAYQRLCSRILISLVGRVIVFSSMTETYLRSINERVPLFHVPYAVPATPTVPKPSPKWRSGIRTFGYLGVNTPRKNIDRFLRAFMALEEPDIAVHVGGFDPAPDAPRDNRIRYWGYVDGKVREDFYAAVDVLVLPSMADPWGLVVNEALHRGCLAAVSTGCGSSEMVGLISEEFVFKTDEEHISRFLRFALELAPESREELQHRAATIIEAYSIEKTSAIWHQLFTEWLGMRRSEIFAMRTTSVGGL